MMAIRFPILLSQSQHPLIPHHHHSPVERYRTWIGASTTTPGGTTTTTASLATAPLRTENGPPLEAESVPCGGGAA